MSSAASAEFPGASRGARVAEVAEWAAVSFVAAIVVYFAAGLLSGFSMDYEVHRNQVLVWSAVAGGAGFSAWYGWAVHSRGTHSGGVWAIPGSALAVWALATGAVLWLAAALTDTSRLDTSVVEYGELVPRVPVEWGMWVPLAVVAALPLLYARRRGVLRWAIASLPLQALWWWATLSAAS